MNDPWKDLFEKALFKLKEIESIFLRLQSIPTQEAVVTIDDPQLFNQIIAHLGPALDPAKARVDLQKIYSVAFHQKTSSLIIANKGCTLLAKSPLSNAPYMLHHIACCIYRPGFGVEVVNVGIVGNIYQGTVTIRSESACIPSFLFRSQRCNCCYQWGSVQELAAHLNPIQPPEGLSPEEFEVWVEKQFNRDHQGRWIPLSGGPGCLLIHLDSQGGMGSGFDPNAFTFDPFLKGTLRQMGEMTTEQVFHTSLKEGYEALGITPDARSQVGGKGYETPAIICDWLRSSKTIHLLSNNNGKIEAFQKAGYEVTRIKTVGMVGAAGAREANYRKAEFQHIDFDGTQVSFEEEVERLKQQIT